MGYEGTKEDMQERIRSALGAFFFVISLVNGISVSEWWFLISFFNNS